MCRKETNKPIAATAFLLPLKQCGCKEQPIYEMNMQLKCLLICFLLAASQWLMAQNPLPPIGNWREHLPYQQTIQVVKGDKIYCATPNNVFAIDEDEIIRFSKVTGLNDIGVNTIGWDAASQQLITVYNNSNIDVIKGSIVKNIGDVKRSTISGNKTIAAVYCADNLAYLCSGLGIIIADLKKYEIKDTWIIGNNGNQVNINGFTIAHNFFYAATAEGLKRLPINAANPSNFSNWQNISGVNGLSPGNIRSVVTSGNNVLALKNDSVFISNGDNFSLFYADQNWPIVSINTGENKIVLCQRTNSGASRVVQLSNTGAIEKILQQSGVISFPKWALVDDNTVWIADFFGGLSNFSSTVRRYIPNGPLGEASGEFCFSQNRLFVAAGSVNAAWNYQYNRDGVFSFADGSWNYKGYFNTPILDSVLDFITVTPDSRDNSIWAGSYGGGLVHFGNIQTTIYKQRNSTLQAAIGDPTSFRVSGLVFDQNNNLWVANYGAAQNIQVRKADGTWKAFGIPFFHFENAISQLLVDDANQIWMVSPRGNGVFCLNYGSSIDNTNDDQWKYFRVGSGAGNLPSNEVYCLAKDKNGFIWIGTAKGVAIVQCPTEVFSPNRCEAILPIVQQDRFAGFLFQNEEVQTIAVDGANRKWVGTKNGVWLISAEGDKIIYRFTEENSPLLSNDVKKIGIDPATGEVFFATFKGICSFRSTATATAEQMDDVLVFPNPVPKGYSGTIAIKGLQDNALVKIAEADGRLVFQTRSLGGQAVWNGRNYKGERIAPGVYLVLIRTDEGKEKAVTKIVITGK